MSLLQGSELESSVYLCAFECLVRQASILIKFPCSYFVEWTTAGGKNASSTQKHKPEQGHVFFNERLTISTEMIYSQKTQQYSRKESTVELFLVSKSRPDQNKLVGRVTIDLAKIVNVDMYAQPTEFKLNFCSVPGSITLQFALLNKKLTSMKVQDLDRSSFIDYISQISVKQPRNGHPPKNEDANQLKLAASAISKEDRSNIRTSLDRECSANSLAAAEKTWNGHRSQLGAKSKLVQSGIDEAARIAREQVPSLCQISKQVTFGAADDKLPALTTHKQPPAYSEPIAVEKDVTKSKRLQYKDEVKEIQLNVENCESQSQQKIGQLPHQAAKPKKDLEDVKVPEAKAHRGTGDQEPSVVGRDQKLVSRELNMLEQGEQKERQLDQILQVKLESSQKLDSIREEYEQKQLILEQTNADLKAQLAQKDKLVAQLSDTLQERDRQSQEIRQLLAEMERRNSSASVRAEEQKKQSNKILESYKVEIQELNDSLVEYESRVALYEEKFLNLESMLKNLEELNEQYRGELTQSSSVQLRLQEQLSQTLNQNNQLKQEIQSRASEILMVHSSDQKLTQLSNQIHSLMGKNKQLEEAMEITSAQCQKKKEDYDTLHSAYVELGRQLELKNTSSAEPISVQKQSDLEYIARLQQELEVLANETGKLRQQVSVSNEEVTRLNAEIQFLKMSLEMNQKQYTDQIENLRVNITLLEQRLEQSSLKGSQLEAASTCISQSYPSTIPHQNTHPQELETLQAKIEELNILSNKKQKENAELKAESNRMSEEMVCYQKQLAILRSENTHLRASIEAVHNSTLEQKDSKINVEEIEQRCSEYEMRIAKLNSNLEQQINQNNQLSEIVIKYMEKESKMKETLAVLEVESKEIFVLFQEKEHNQETYQKMIENLQREIDKMKVNFHEIHSEEEPSPTKVIYRSPRESIKGSAILDDEREEAVRSLQLANKQLQMELQDLTQKNNQLNERLLHLVWVEQKYQLLRVELEAQQQRHSQLQAEFMKKIIGVSDRPSQLEMEIGTMQAKFLQISDVKNRLEAQLQKMRLEIELIEEEKFGIQSENNQKDIRIAQLEEQLKLLVVQIEEMQCTTYEAQNYSTRLEEMYASIASLRDRMSSNSVHPEWESLIKNVLDRSLGGEEAARFIDIEEKSRLLSKQMQKLKAQILKSSSRSQQEKLAFMKEIKNCESIISELIAAAQALNLNQSSFL